MILMRPDGVTEVCCSLCTVSVEARHQRRKIFGSRSPSVLPLLVQLTFIIYGQGAVQFLLRLETLQAVVQKTLETRKAEERGSETEIGAFTGVTRLGDSCSVQTVSTCTQHRSKIGDSSVL